MGAKVYTLNSFFSLAETLNRSNSGGSAQEHCKKVFLARKKQPLF